MRPGACDSLSPPRPQSRTETTPLDRDVNLTSAEHVALSFGEMQALKWLRLSVALVCALGASCSSEASRSASAWPSLPTAGTATISVSGDHNQQYRWRVSTTPQSPLREGPLSPGCRRPGYARRTHNRCIRPFVGEAKTTDVEGERVVLVLVLPGDGTFIAGEGDCRIEVSEASESAVEGRATCDSVRDASGVKEVALDIVFNAEE